MVPPDSFTTFIMDLLRPPAMKVCEACPFEDIQLSKSASFRMKHLLLWGFVIF